MSQSVHMFPNPNPVSSAPQWHVLGTGAMGCLWACRILEALGPGSVQMIVRNQETLERFQGYLTMEVDGHSTRYPIAASLAEQLAGDSRPADPQAAAEEMAVKRLILATKAHDLSTAFRQVRHATTTDAPIVMLQNGIRAQMEMMKQYPDRHWYALSTSHGAWLRAPFHVVHAGFGEAWLGPLTQANQASISFSGSSLPLPWQPMNIHPDSQIVARLWRKFAINCAINGLTAIHDCCNGELLSTPEYRVELHALCAEISHLLTQISGVPEVPDLYRTVEQVLTVTASNHSSTHQDIRHGRRTEIRELNGFLCDMASEHSLPCPHNQSVLSQVLALEQQAVNA